MQPAAPPSPSPPAWTQGVWGKRLVQVNATKNSLNPTALAHVLIAVSIGAGAFVLYVSTLGSILILSKEWRICPREVSAISQVSPSQAGQNQALKQGVGTLPDLNQINSAIDLLDPRILPSQKLRLKSQVAQLREAQFTACSIGVFFFANRNAALTVSTAAAILAFSSLAFVSKNGWEGTNNAIINVGLSSALVLFAAWSFSQLYGQGVNYENQRTKVVLATNLLNGVASAVANKNAIRLDGKPAAANATPEEKSLPLVDVANVTLLIQSIDKQLEVINDLNFGGDSSFAEDAAKKFGKLLNSTPLPEPTKP
jgi:hypothetical protein